MKIMMVNGMGVSKEVKVGFSWTNLFFGAFTPLVRGDFKWAAIQVVAALITSGISVLIFPFFYNKLYIKDLLEKGYNPVTEDGRRILISKGYLADSSTVDNAEDLRNRDLFSDSLDDLTDE